MAMPLFHEPILDPKQIDNLASNTNSQISDTFSILSEGFQGLHSFLFNPISKSAKANSSEGNLLQDDEVYLSSNRTDTSEKSNFSRMAVLNRFRRKSFDTITCNSVKERSKSVPSKQRRMTES